MTFFHELAGAKAHASLSWACHSGLLVAFLYFKTTSKSEGGKAPGAASATSKVAPHPGPRADAKKDRDGLRQALSKFLILIGYRFIR